MKVMIAQTEQHAKWAILTLFIDFNYSSIDA